MKLPVFVQNIIKTPEKSEIYLSLVLETDYVAGSCWLFNSQKKPKLLHAVVRRIQKDTWEEKISASDQVISALEHKTESEALYKVIFGLPANFLTETGDIEHIVRTELKKLTEELSLKPIGYVPIYHALAFTLRQDEGVPPSVILVGVTGKKLTISIYKVGTLIGYSCIDYPIGNDNKALAIAETLKRLTQAEVLPTRILLYGVDKNALESLEADCNNFPWTSHVHVLHLPKIEVLPLDAVVRSVSLAGASELNNSSESGDAVAKPDTDNGNDNTYPDAAAKEVDTTREDIPDEVDTEIEAKHMEQEETPVSHNAMEYDPLPDGKETVVETELDVQDEKKIITHNDGESVWMKDDDEFSGVSEPLMPSANKVHTDEDVAAGPSVQSFDKDHENVSYVPAASLGFQTKDVSVMTPVTPAKQKKNDYETSIESEDEISTRPYTKPVGRQSFGNLLERVQGMVPKFGGQKYVLLFLIPIIAIAMFGLYYISAYVLPKANVSLKVTPKNLDISEDVSFSPEISETNAEDLQLPVKMMEQTVNGEDTIVVTGSKKIGDPAKGAVTVYNKSLSAKSFKKGAILTGNNLSFTLDSDVDVASASESIGSITFGKANVNVTAADIGTQGNIDASTEFSFKTTPSSVAIARNDKAFSGGSSKEVTVVTRSDYDALVAKISKQLLDKGKQQLTGTLSGDQIFIDDTISSKISDKKFDSELGQEVKELHGTVAMTISGSVVDKNEIAKTFMTKLVELAGQEYEISDGSVDVQLTGTKVKKDGTITSKAGIQAKAYPNINTDTLKQTLAGKKLQDAYNHLKSVTGISEAVIEFSRSLNRSSLPRNINNISIVIQK